MSAWLQTSSPQRRGPCYFRLSENLLDCEECLLVSAVTITKGHPMHAVIGSLSFSPHRVEAAKKDGKGSGQQEWNMKRVQDKNNMWIPLWYSNMWKLEKLETKTALDTHSRTGCTVTCSERGGVGWGRERKSSWDKCKAGSHVTCNVWCLRSCGGGGGCRIVHRYACSSAVQDQGWVTCMFAKEALREAAWPDQMAHQESTAPRCNQNPAFGHCLPKPSLLQGFQMGTQTGTWARSHEDSLKPPGGHLLLKTEREKRGKKQMGREWVLWSSRLQVIQCLTYFWCACITKVLALSHKLSHHAHHESQARTLSEQRNESGSRKRGMFCLKVIPYLISATFIRLSPWCFFFRQDTQSSGSAKRFEGLCLYLLVVLMCVRVCLCVGGFWTSRNRCSDPCCRVHG